MTRSLLDKLGYRSGMPTRIWGLPGELTDVFSAVTPGDPPVFLLAFAADQAALAACASEVIGLYRRGHWLWFAYPKKSGRLKSDLTRDIGWAPVQSVDLLGVTQIAVDNTWSALRFRFRDEIGKLTRREIV